MRTSKGSLFRACNRKRVSNHHLLLAGRRVWELYSEDRKRLWYALNGRGWEGEAWGRVNRSEVSYMIGLEADLTLSGWSWVISKGKNWESGSHWSGSDSSGWIAAKIVGWLVGWCCRQCRSEFYCHIRSSHYLFAFSVSRITPDWRLVIDTIIFPKYNSFLRAR